MECSQKRSFNTKDSTFEVGSVVKDPEDRKYLILRFCEGGAEPEALLQCDDTKDYVRKSIFDLFPQPEQLQAQVADDLFQQLLSKYAVSIFAGFADVFLTFHHFSNQGM